MMVEYAVNRCSSGCRDGLTADTCQGLFHHFERIITSIYIDDSFYSVESVEKRFEIPAYITFLFSKFSFQVNGFCHSFLPPTANNPLLDEFFRIRAAGNLYTPGSDYWSVRPPIILNSFKHRGDLIQDKPKRVKVKNEWVKHDPPALILKDYSFKSGVEQPEITVNELSDIFKGRRPTLSLILSKTMLVFDSSGILGPIIGQLRHCVRIAAKETLGKYDEEILRQLWDHWFL